MKKKDCAIIPAYNEENTITEVVTRVKKTGIVPIVVDDNSRDKTYELAKKSGAIVLKQNSNMGKGEAIRTGIIYVLDKMPKTENIVFIDADMQYCPEEAAKLLEPLNNGEADMVMGFRDWSTVPARHKLGNFVWKNSFNILFGTRMKDTNCGFMAVTRDTAKVIKDSLYGGYIIENALLSRAVRSGMKIGQVPVTVSYNHRSGVPRGIRMVVGITLFIILEGLKYRFGKDW